MKNALIGGLLVSALLATAPAFAQSSYGGKSRAEVKAELASARRAGDRRRVRCLPCALAPLSGEPPLPGHSRHEWDGSIVAPHAAVDSSPACGR